MTAVFDVVDRRVPLVDLLEVEELIACTNAGVEVLILKLHRATDLLRIEADRLREVRGTQLRDHSGDSHLPAPLQAPKSARGQDEGEDRSHAEREECKDEE